MWSLFQKDKKVKRQNTTRQKRPKDKKAKIQKDKKTKIQQGKKAKRQYTERQKDKKNIKTKLCPLVMGPEGPPSPPQELEQEGHRPPKF